MFTTRFFVLPPFTSDGNGQDANDDDGCKSEIPMPMAICAVDLRAPYHCPGHYQPLVETNIMRSEFPLPHRDHRFLLLACFSRCVVCVSILRPSIRFELSCCPALLIPCPIPVDHAFPSASYSVGPLPRVLHSVHSFPLPGNPRLTRKQLRPTQWTRSKRRQPFCLAPASPKENQPCHQIHFRTRKCRARDESRSS